MSGEYSGRATASHEWSDVHLPESGGGDRVVLASIDTYNGNDTADVRMRTTDSDGVELFVEEEQSSDDETRHLREEIGYFGTDTGYITDDSGNRIGESGVVETSQPDADHWHSVTLDGSYSDPVVFMQVMSHNGSDPCHVRLRNVGSSSFEYKIEEWDYLNGPHVEERVGYVALDSGIHRLSDGLPLEVGTASVNHAWQDINFSASVGTDPVFITRCQTYNGGDEVVTRNRRVTAAGAGVRLQEEEGSNRQHTDETIGYMVLPRVLSGITSERVTSTHEWSDVNFSDSQPSDVVIASIDTFNGEDTAGVRMRDVDAGGMELFVEDEASADDEMRHVEEVIGLFKIGSGPIFDDSGTRIGESGTITRDQPAGDQWHSLGLEGRYSDPVVFMQVMSYNGGNPCHVRLQNVSSDSFEYKIEEWDYLDGKHTDEQIGYVVLESGVHDLAGGGFVEVGTTDGDHSWTSLSFSGNVGTNPVLITRCQTYNGGDEVVTRNRRVTAAGADVRLQEEEGSNRQHTDETIGYMVSPRTTADLTAGKVEVSEDWSNVSLSGVPATDPVVIPSIETFHGDDTIAVRMRNVGSNEMEVFLEEETSEDDETNHLSETVGLFATTVGPIYDESGSQIGEAGIVETNQPDASHWHAVDLDGSYSDPVAFMQVMSHNGGDPCHVRLQNVGSDSFEYKIEEWQYLNGKHTEERLGYVVFEEDVHEIEGEIPIEAGFEETTHQFSDVNFDNEFRCDPVFVTQCQTYNGWHQVVTRNRNVRTDGAEVRLQEEEGRDGQHTEEDVGYLVVPQLILGNRRPLDEFHPSCHGFAFRNDFHELPDLPDLPGDVVPDEIDTRIEDIAPGYGLCGGMSLAARDFYLHDRPIPEDTATPQSGPLFDYLWQRQLDSFDPANGWQYLKKFLNFYLPTTFTRARSVSELRSLKEALDRGANPILGLVYVRMGDGNPWNNHQVLAFDYTESGDRTDIHVYDPNCPGDNDVEVRVTIEDDWGVPGGEKISAAEYNGGTKMTHNELGELDIIGLIHMDVPSQEPPQNL